MANFQLSSRTTAMTLLCLVGLAFSTGCHSIGGLSSTGSRTSWSRLAECDSLGSLLRYWVCGESSTNGFSEVLWPGEGSDLSRAVKFLEFADSLSAKEDPRSTDYYYEAAVLSWQSIEGCSSVGDASPVMAIYHASLSGLITEATRFCRFNAQGQLRIHLPDGPTDIAIVGNNMNWPVEQLSEFQIAGKPKHNKLKSYYAEPGMGVPIVAVRRKVSDVQQDPTERFFPTRLPVAATIVLRPREHVSGGANCESSAEFILEIVNPLKVASVTIGVLQLPMARDISAPLQDQLDSRPFNPLTDFISPGIGSQDDGLRWQEPYQPGKIPVVFVHGLLSDPTTWFDMVNHLRTQAWFNDKYQVWGFSYATGNPFVTSAEGLRNELREAVAIVDPQHHDTTLRQMVLVGHSMGGLLAKLQISESDDQLWNSVAKVPLDSIYASDEVRQQLAKRLYFSPQPFVKRVVYIATPHSGSAFAARGIGRCSSLLVRPDEERREQHEQLIRDNPEVFIGLFRKRIPTSIDLLQPDNPTLQAIHDLRVPEDIAQHTILGTGRWPLTCGVSDGVVPVESARHPSAVSCASVDSCHTQITREDKTTCEVMRILRLHLESSCFDSTNQIDF